MRLRNRVFVRVGHLLSSSFTKHHDSFLSEKSVRATSSLSLLVSHNILERKKLLKGPDIVPWKSKTCVNIIPSSGLGGGVGCWRGMSSNLHIENDTDIEDLRSGLPAEDERMIDALIQYKETHGDCHVPSGTSKFAQAERDRLSVSEELVHWVRLQRRRYLAFQKGIPKNKVVAQQDQVRFLVLDSLGFMWSDREAQWQRSFNRLEAHKAKTGTLEVDRESDSQLWNWVDQQRKAYQKKKLTEERQRLLEEIGFVFDLHEAAWWLYHEKLSDYVDKNGDAKVPHQYEQDPPLGLWVARQRRDYHSGQLSTKRIMALESIGFAWSVYDEAWDHFFNELVDFHSTHGHTRVTRSEGSLWHWVDRQRRLLRAKVKDNQALNEREGKIAALNNIDFDWLDDDSEGRTRRLMDLTFSVEVQEERWLENFNRLTEFKEKYGHFAIPPDKIDFQELNSWVKHQRYLRKRNKLAEDRVKMLNEIGFPWTAQIARWDILYEKLVRFHSEHGHTRVPTRNTELYRWLNQQRKRIREVEDGSSGNISKGQMEHRLKALAEILDP